MIHSVLLRRILVLTVYANILAQLCHAEWVTGVLLGENGGQGADPVRGIELAVGDHIYRLEYAPKYFQPRFRNQACWDLGSIWRVKVTKLVDLGDLINVRCTGKVDEWAFQPALLVKTYLNGLAKSLDTSHEDVFSVRFKNSPEFEQYQAKARSLNFSENLTRDGPAGCLEVVKIERLSRTEIRSPNCAISIGNSLVDLHFRVVQDVDKKRWKIDEIKIE